jgi:hypothetical protein
VCLLLWWASDCTHNRQPITSVQSSVADPAPDPNPDQSDPYVFGPPRSASISKRYGSGSGSGSFYHQAKIVRKTLIHTVL